MVARQATSHSLKSIAGALLIALGLVFLFASVDSVAAGISNFAGISAHEAVGILPTLGLAGLHALQAYTFDHEAFVSGVQQNLVSFWPLIVIAIGAGLLKSGFESRFAKPAVRTGGSDAGGR